MRENEAENALDADADNEIETLSETELFPRLALYVRMCGALTDGARSQQDIADLIGRPKSAVNQCLKDLRKHYGRKLLFKDEDSLKLTEAGEELLAGASRILRLHHDLSASSLQEAIGDVVVGAGSAYVRVCLPGVVRAYHLQTPRQAPPAIVRFVERNTEHVIRLLRSGSVDIGLALKSTRGDYLDLVHHDLPFTVELRLVARMDSKVVKSLGKEEPVALKKLAGAVVCLTAPDEMKLRADGLPPPSGHDRVVVEEYASVLPLVRAGAADVGIVATVGETIKQFEGIHPRELVVRKLLLKKNQPREFVAWTSGPAEKLLPPVRDFLNVLMNYAG